MNEWDARLLAIVNRAVRKAQDENRRKGVPNVYVVNGTLVWQLPDGTVTAVDPNRQFGGASRKTEEGVPRGNSRRGAESRRQPGFQPQGTQGQKTSNRMS